MDGRIILEVKRKNHRTGTGRDFIYGIWNIRNQCFSAEPLCSAWGCGRKTAVYHLDLMPKLTKEELVQYLADRQRQNGTYKNPQELLIGLLPKKIIDVLGKKKNL